jgi:bacterioferritin-associated ferredoxin
MEIARSWCAATRQAMSDAGRTIEQLSVPSDLVCFCFGVSRQTVLDQIRRPGSSYEKLIKETGIGTKCTACRLNLEILLGDHVNFARATSSDQRAPKGWKIVNDQLNCAFFFARHDMHTVLRFANPKIPLSTKVPLTAHDWRLTIFSDAGAVIHRDSGVLEVDAAETIDFSKRTRFPKFGWFTLDMLPQNDGFVGNIRPQCLLAGLGWAVAYHPQLTMYAARRRSVMLPTANGRYDTLFPVINTNSSACEVTVSVSGISAAFEDQGSVTIPGYGAHLIDVDAILRQPPPGQLAIALVTSTQPVRHFVMHKHASGSYAVDHFPNSR